MAAQAIGGSAGTIAQLMQQSNRLSDSGNSSGAADINKLIELEAQKHKNAMLRSQLNREMSAKDKALSKYNDAEEKLTAMGINLHKAGLEARYQTQISQLTLSEAEKRHQIQQESTEEIHDIELGIAKNSLKREQWVARREATRRIIARLRKKQAESGLTPEESVDLNVFERSLTEALMSGENEAERYKAYQVNGLLNKYNERGNDAQGEAERIQGEVYDALGVGGNATTGTPPGTGAAIPETATQPPPSPQGVAPTTEPTSPTPPASQGAGVAPATPATPPTTGATPPVEGFDARVKLHEGFRKTPYELDGIPHIGYGRNLQDNPITAEQKETLGGDAEYDANGNITSITKAGANKLYEVDMAHAEKVASQTIGPAYDKLSPARKSVVKEMIYNMGSKSFGEFKRFHAALQVGDYDTAAQEMKVNVAGTGESAWIKRLPERVNRLSNIMENGDTVAEIVPTGEKKEIDIAKLTAKMKRAQGYSNTAKENYDMADRISLHHVLPELGKDIRPLVEQAIEAGVADPALVLLAASQKGEIILTAEQESDLIKKINELKPVGKGASGGKGEPLTTMSYLEENKVYHDGKQRAAYENIGAQVNAFKALDGIEVGQEWWQRQETFLRVDFLKRDTKRGSPTPSLETAQKSYETLNSMVYQMRRKYLRPEDVNAAMTEVQDLVARLNEVSPLDKNSRISNDGELGEIPRGRMGFLRTLQRIKKLHPTLYREYFQNLNAKAENSPATWADLTSRGLLDDARNIDFVRKALWGNFFTRKPRSLVELESIGKKNKTTKPAPKSPTAVVPKVSPPVREMDDEWIEWDPETGQYNTATVEGIKDKKFRGKTTKEYLINGKWTTKPKQHAAPITGSVPIPRDALKKLSSGTPVVIDGNTYTFNKFGAIRKRPNMLTVTDETGEKKVFGSNKKVFFPEGTTIEEIRDATRGIKSPTKTPGTPVNKNGASVIEDAVMPNVSKKKVGAASLTNSWKLKKDGKIYTIDQLHFLNARIKNIPQSFQDVDSMGRGGDVSIEIPDAWDKIEPFGTIDDTPNIPKAFRGTTIAERGSPGMRLEHKDGKLYLVGTQIRIAGFDGVELGTDAGPAARAALIRLFQDGEPWVTKGTEFTFKIRAYGDIRNHAEEPYWDNPKYKRLVTDVYIREKGQARKIGTAVFISAADALIQEGYGKEWIPRPGQAARRERAWQ